MKKIKELEMSSYPRRQHFEYFMSLDAPFIAMTVNLDITDYYHFIKKKGYPVFLSIQYVIGHSANKVKEFRQRIKDNKIIEYEWCDCSYTALRSDNSYRYCSVRTDLPFEEYIKQAKQEQEKILNTDELVEGEDPQSYFYISSTPWMSFSGLTVPYNSVTFSVPCLTLSKFYFENKIEDDGSVKKYVILPLAIQVNHALMDGYHIGQFVNGIEEEMKKVMKENS